MTELLEPAWRYVQKKGDLDDRLFSKDDKFYCNDQATVNPAIMMVTMLIRFSPSVSSCT